MQASKEERGSSTKRTLQSIREHYLSFVEDGSRRNRSKDVSFSIVDNPTLDIEIDHVSKINNKKIPFFGPHPPLFLS